MEGKRAQCPLKDRMPVILGGAAAVLAAAYIGLCIWTGASGRILPNVTIGGVDVSGQTREQAQAVLTDAVAQTGADVNVELTWERGNWSGCLSGEEIAPLSADNVQRAMAVGREHFLLRGARYLGHLLGAGTDVELTVNARTEARDALLAQAEDAVQTPVSQMKYRVEDDRLLVTKGVTGVRVEREQAANVLDQALAQAFEKALRGQKGECTAELPVQETAPDAPDCDGLWKQLYTAVEDAQVDPQTYTVTDHKVGVDFDVDALKAEYEAAQEGETFAIPLTLTQPEESRESLEAKLFRDVLGQATSKVSGTANRKTNVQLAAAACNGKILMPGEVFSYNGTTGSRTADKGYLPAPIYVGGKSQDDIGGGICQPSSTIYYAVLHTTLEIVERHNHTFAVGYVPDGMDATVYYGSLDFQFRNSTDYPIKIVAESYDKDGSRYLTIKILGTNVDGRYARPERTQFDWVEPTTVYQADESVPRGTLVLDKEQYAYKGRKAQTYRYIYEKDGTLVEKQDLGVSRYKMRPHTYYYNPADGDPAAWVDGQPPKPVTQPEQPGSSGETTVPADPVEQPGQSQETGGTSQETENGPTGEGGLLPEQSTEPAQETQDAQQL